MSQITFHAFDEVISDSHLLPPTKILCCNKFCSVFQMPLDSSLILHQQGSAVALLESTSGHMSSSPKLENILITVGLD